MYSSRYMAQFVVAAPDDDNIAAAIRTTYPSDHLKVWDGLWLLSDEGSTAQEVSIKLGIADGKLGTVVIASISGYYGFAPKNVWEWLAVKGTQRYWTST